MTRRLHRLTGERDLCLAGGVALNCVSNRVLFEQGPFERLYIQPATHDAGTAIGAAAAIWHGLLGGDHRPVMDHAYLGPAFTEAEVSAAVRAAGLPHRRLPDIAATVAELLAGGAIIGWFQGAMEIGPRALGNRSLLADPRNPAVRDLLNIKVKHREPFRPFAPSVLAEEAERWFEIGRPTSAAEYMLVAYPVRPEQRARIPAVTHADGSSRIHVVRPGVNPRYHRLLRAFQAVTGVPVLLNTSFNDDEPIVCSPADALATFTKTDIDLLALGDMLVWKPGRAAMAPP